MDLLQRLERLELLSGVKFEIVEPVADPEPEENPGQIPEEVGSKVEDHTPVQAEPYQKHASAQTDTPHKFLTHDAGPRVRTEGAFDNANFEVGKPAHAEMDFCPWKLVKGYPWSYVGIRNRPHVIPYFEKIFEGRVWDFFYLYHPVKPKEKPYLFIPIAQFQAFLDWINKDLGIALAIPGGVNSERFFLRFGQGGTARPRYLKRIREEVDNDISQWPDIDSEDAESFKNASPIIKDDLEHKLELINVKPKKDKDLAKKQRAAKRKADRDFALAETQALLGLNEDQAIHDGANGKDVVFICFDAEAIERPPNPISEVGIAILNMKDVNGVGRGPCARDWWPHIRAYHLRTKEYSGLVNHKYIAGCPDDFDFGTSTFPTRDEMSNAVMEILDPHIQSGRELVLVGHDVKQDIQYVSRLGVDLTDITGFSRTLDSQVAHLAWKEMDNGRSLESVLADLGIPSKHLHNAGNDAVFTMRALIGVAVEAKRQREAEAEGGEYVPELWAARVQQVA